MALNLTPANGAIIMLQRLPGHRAGDRHGAGGGPGAGGGGGQRARASALLQRSMVLPPFELLTTPSGTPVKCAPAASSSATAANQLVAENPRMLTALGRAHAIWLHWHQE